MRGRWWRTLGCVIGIPASVFLAVIALAYAPTCHQFTKQEEVERWLGEHRGELEAAVRSVTWNEQGTGFQRSDGRAPAALSILWEQGAHGVFGIIEFGRLSVEIDFISVLLSGKEVESGQLTWTVTRRGHRSS